MPFDTISHVSEEFHANDVDQSVIFKGIGSALAVGAYNRASYQCIPTEMASSAFTLKVQQTNDPSFQRWKDTGKTFKPQQDTQFTSSFEIQAMFHRVVPNSAADAHVIVAVRLIAEG